VHPPLGKLGNAVSQDGLAPYGDPPHGDPPHGGPQHGSQHGAGAGAGLALH